jgi:hypothetical protein
MRVKSWLEVLLDLDHSQDLDVGERIILKWISGEIDLESWIEFISLRMGADGVGCCQHYNAPSGCVRGREYLEQLSNCWLLKREA